MAGKHDDCGLLSRLFLSLGAASAMLAVILGAFGAHGLRGKLDPSLFNAFQTGVEYQMYHALALVMVGILFGQCPTAGWRLRWSGYLFTTGIILFSGSLYVLAVSGMRWLGMITPLGGVCFIGAWLLLLIYAMQSGKHCTD
ncbi:MAG: DUF423 domain-containing protein [Gammaproteobacteria bacterium]|nr:DUF423 domain-containing protein [Gammaproteobacteria bacterium]